MAESLPGNMQMVSLEVVQVKFICAYFVPHIL